MNLLNDHVVPLSVVFPKVILDTTVTNELKFSYLLTSGDLATPGGPSIHNLSGVSTCVNQTPLLTVCTFYVVGKILGFVFWFILILPGAQRVIKKLS